MAVCVMHIEIHLSLTLPSSVFVMISDILTLQGVEVSAGGFSDEVLGLDHLRRQLVFHWSRMGPVSNVFYYLTRYMD